MTMVLLSLTPTLFALLFASVFVPEAHATICPRGTTPKHKAYELRVALDNHATFCSIHEQKETSRILAKLLDEAFLDEIFIKRSKTFICPNPTKGRRILAAEGSATASLDSSSGVMTDDPKTRKLSLWGRYVYRGGSRCLHCNPDYGDARRHLSCIQKDKFLPIEGIISTDNWNGELLQEVFKIPKDFSKAIIFFRVVIPGKRAGMKSFQFFNQKYKFMEKIDVNTLLQKEIGHIYTNKMGVVSWAYKIVNRNSNTGYMNVKFSIHFPRRLYEDDEMVRLNILGKKDGNIGVKVRNVHLIGRKFCTGGGPLGDLEREISIHLTNALKQKILQSPDHCLRNRSLRAKVGLSEINNAKTISPC